MSQPAPPTAPGSAGNPPVGTPAPSDKAPSDKAPSDKARGKRRNDGNQRGGRSKKGKQGAPELGDLRADIESLRRSVAFKSDVDEVLDRLQEVSTKLDWVLHSLHSMHGVYDQQAMAAASGGYGSVGF